MIRDLPPTSIHDIKIFLSIDMIRTFSFNLMIISLVLTLTDTLPGTVVGFLWGVNFLFHAILDYPTGVLGDLIGHRTVLAFAYLSKALAVLVLLIANDPTEYMVFMIISAIGNSQESGALEAWFDNRYNNLAATVDKERTIYLKLQAVRLPLLTAMSIGGFLVGGIIASASSRTNVFVLHFLIEFVVLVLVLLLLRGRASVKSQAVSVRGYLQKAVNTLGFLLRRRYLMLYFLGTALIFAVNGTVWWTLMLFQLYRDYTGSDAGASVLRSLVYLSGVFWQVILVRIALRFRKAMFWVFLSSLLSNAVFFLLVMFLYLILPPSGLLILPIILLLLIYQIPSFLESLDAMLRNKLNLDLIPDDYRNGLYSLLPTLVTILGFPFVFVAGATIEGFGLVAGFVILIGISLAGSFLLGLGLLSGRQKLSLKGHGIDPLPAGK